MQMLVDYNQLQNYLILDILMNWCLQLGLDENKYFDQIISW